MSWRGNSGGPPGHPYAVSRGVTSVLVQRAAMPPHASRSLTAREQQVLELMSRGLNNQQIASELSISLSTANST